MKVETLKKLLENVPDNMEVWFQPEDAPFVYPVFKGYIEGSYFVLSSDDEE